MIRSWLKARQAAMHRAVLRAELSNNLVALGASRVLADDIALGLDPQTKADVQTITGYAARHATPAFWADVAARKDPR